MLKESKWPQYGRSGLTVHGIVLHNTDHYTDKADYIFNYLENECQTSEGTHFLIDNENTIEVMPTDWKTWSTGKGDDWAFHNCISITICNNINDILYKAGQDKAVALIKELLTKYNLTKNDIYFHNDFNERAYCPNTMLDKYGSVKRFVVEEMEE